MSTALEQLTRARDILSERYVRAHLGKWETTSDGALIIEGDEGDYEIFGELDDKRDADLIVLTHAALPALIELFSEIIGWAEITGHIPDGQLMAFPVNRTMVALAEAVIGAAG